MYWHSLWNDFCSQVISECRVDSYQLRRYGHGGNGFVRTVGKMVVQSGASFGLFMGIGAGIRCDDGHAITKKEAMP